MTTIEKLFANQSSNTVSTKKIDYKNKLKKLIQNNNNVSSQPFDSSIYSKQEVTRFVRGNNARFTDSSFSKGNTYTSFSGADSIVSVVFRGGKPITIGECQTLSYSSFRQITPVFTLGKAKPKGHVRGPRTIAGSIIFTVFDRHVLIAALHQAFAGSSAKCLDWDILPDELPPFDFYITFLNEYGQSAQIVIYDVKLTTEGQVHSIEDLITENTAQFIASDMKIMEPNVVENT